MKELFKLELESGNNITFYKMDGSDGFYWDTLIYVKYIDADNNNEITIYKDFLLNGLRALINSLNNLVNIEEKNIEFGRDNYLGYNKNLEYNNMEQFEVEYYSTWSTHQTETYFYKSEDNYYLEISPIYKWHFASDEELKDQNYISFDEFISTFSPYVFEEITKTKIQLWIKICCEKFNLWYPSEWL